MRFPQIALVRDYAIRIPPEELKSIEALKADTRRIHGAGRNTLNTFRMSGAGGGTRTHDLGIMRPSLYP